MSKDKRDFTIKVTKPATDYVVELFENNTKIGASDELEFNKTQDGLKKTAHYQLNFKIDDSSLAPADKVKFAPSNTDVMYVWTDVTSCPGPGNHMDDSFWVDKNNNGRDLRLINMDLKAEKMRFKINMVKVNDPTAPFIELDPIISNGNRGGGEPIIRALLATGVAAGTTVGILAAALANQAFDAQDTVVYGIGGALVGLIVGFVLDRI